MKYRWLALACVLLALFALGFVGCSGDDSGQSDAQADVSTKDVKADAPATKDGAADVVAKDSASDAASDAASSDVASEVPVVTTFNVASAASTGNTQMIVTFDAPPDPTSATTLANYAVPGLTLSGTPILANDTVTITTSAQTATSYTVTVSNVTRASDSEALTGHTATFTGVGTFNVLTAASVTAGTLTVTFDAAPDPGTAQTVGNYAVPGLTLSGKVGLNGNTVTLATSTQSATSYTVTVSNVIRASDNTPLTVNTANFMGRMPFDVASAKSLSSTSMSVTFDAAPDPTAATTLANYMVAGLTLSGTPTLLANTVTITTSAQSATTYSVGVLNVTRASDTEPLSVKDASFNGTAPLAPTVTNVAVKSTNPSNATTPYDTGTSTVTITGTDFATVVCPAGVALDDLDGVGAAVSTTPTTCTVDSDTQITATFPAGIRTNGATGWNVKVTNTVGTNATSAVPFAPVAGLVISEVYTGSTGNASHEFVEVYNPTGNSIDAIGLGLHMHIRNASGVDTNKTLTPVTTAIIPKHGFLLIVSAASASTDAWYANRDYTYSDALAINNGVYISLSATVGAKVLDRVGWGSQPVNGYEGTALSQINADNSVERKPAGGQGHATDTDVNTSDFNVESTTITPRGTVDAPQP